jgi:NhaP-type Na+/H+ or K+/H+ antiporter
VVDELRDSGEPVGRTVLAGVAVLLLVVVVRFAWVTLVFGRAALSVRSFQQRLARDAKLRARYDDMQAKRAARGRPLREIPPVLGWRESMLVSWTGMRGIVTLGAAGGIPLLTQAGEPFPHRTTLQFLAYLVVAGTLLLQGPTLPTLVRWLGIDRSAEDRAAAEEVARAFELAEAAAGSGYDAQREAMSLAVREQEIDDETARVVLEWIDRQESARAEPHP